MLAAFQARAAVPDLPIMPLPAHVEPGEGALAIDGRFQVGVCGKPDPSMDAAVARFVGQLTAETGLILPAAMAAPDCAKASLTIEAARQITVPRLGDDESYTLRITHESAELKAATSLGILRGLATFQQLVEPGAQGFSVPSLTIEDRPRFPWRGFMLDASRHWMPLAVMERNLDGMAAVKLNVFHWHLSDDQGFRVESRVFPKLQGLGSDGNFYTQEQIRHVVRYAAERGIRVVPEFDIPGHTTTWMIGYPELASAAGPYQIERKWGVQEATLDPTRETTYRFLERFLAEMTPLFPDAYFHIGGDEVAPAQWNANPAIQKFMASHGMDSPARLQEYFNGRLEAMLIRHGRKMIGWDEILTPDLPKTAIVQSWRGQESLAAAARGGHQSLLSSGYYLDHMKSAAYHYANDPLGAGAKDLPADQAALILGGEACMWTEYADAETVDSRTWPRLAVVAERLWSRAEVTDLESMYNRLARVSRKLEWVGLQHRAAQARMLDRMAGYREEPGLEVLANAVEAVGIHERYPSHGYNSLEPMNRLVDAAVAESETVRGLIADAGAVVKQRGSAAESARLRDAFQSWQRLPATLAPLATQSFFVTEAIPVSDLLSRLGVAGEAALGYIERGERPPPDWIRNQQDLLTEASKQVSEVRIAGVEPVRILMSVFSAPAKP